MHKQLAPILLFLLAGCGEDGPALTDVSGTVTLDGKPVPNATVMFVPSAEGGSPSYGVTDAQGNYTLMFTRDKEGAMPGRHTVEITTEKLSKQDIEDMRANGEEVAEAEYVEIPSKYREPGALSAEVKDGDNDIDFPLTSNDPAPSGQ